MGRLTECLAKWGSLACSIAFIAGVFSSVVAPDWILLRSAPDPNQNNVYIEAEIGPFYSQGRSCVNYFNTTMCSDYMTKALATNDCQNYDFGGSNAPHKLCDQLNIWRFLAWICLVLVVFNGLCVFGGGIIEFITCGCLGGSLDFIAMVISGLEVVTSIVAWSFAISSMYLFRGFLTDAKVELGWGFGLFVGCGTLLGVLSASLLEVASEDSRLAKLFNRCCKNDVENPATPAAKKNAAPAATKNAPPAATPQGKK